MSVDISCIAAANKWLDETLGTLEIDYAAQINTGTVSTALKYAEKHNITPSDNEKLC